MNLNDIRNAGGPLKGPRYSLIIPAHNEAARIAGSLPGYLDAFADSEVLLVLNGCTDDTAQVALAAAGSRSNLRVLYIDHAVGKGGAVRAGFLTAQAPVVGYVDADGATPPEEMRRLFDLVDDQVDAVIASRWFKESQVVVAQPVLRRLSSRIFNAIVRAFFGLPFRDTQCGAKVFTSKAIRGISSSLEVSNFAFDIDLLYGLRRRGYRIKEVPTRWNDVLGSRIDLARASKEMLVAVLRLRMRHSLFRFIIPIFDRLWPTKPLRVRDGLAVLILGARDPQHPRAGDLELFLKEVGRHLVDHGHRIHWLTGNFAGGARDVTIDGMTVTRVGTGLTVRAAIPLAYLKSFRDKFDIIVDVECGLPFLSPLFSLKPKVCLVDRVRPNPRANWFARPFVAARRMLLRRVLQYAYGNSHFMTISNESARDLREMGVAAHRIDVALPPTTPHASDVSFPEAAQRFLDALFRELSRDHASYVRSGQGWSILQHQGRNGARTTNEAREYQTGTRL